ncbi:outer membrane protein assembly factor BamB family protein [Haladaptatus halobius]|uniref:outer membrane protein assembly factor BamB family protein n=1 Tax=Haladaptatus halobius TaxID=2884875 RepID=UPI001D0AAC8F|nr:PQQ-binding-like beta-propeller repeat protein [Haladaptatus halobius]
MIEFREVFTTGREESGEMVPVISRRTALSGLGVAVVGSCTALAGRSGIGVADTDERDAGPDWPMARYDPAGTGYNPDTAGPKRSVRVKWRREPERFSGGVASPILLGDTLYATGQGLTALDAATGSPCFSHEGSYQSSPARADARAYETDTLAVTAPTGVYGLNAGGGRRLFDYEFGVERWHGPTRDPSFDFFGSPGAVPPVTVGRTVYAVVPGTASDTAHIVALDAATGTVRWRFETGPASLPAIGDGVLYVVSHGRVIALEEKR